MNIDRLAAESNPGLRALLSDLSVRAEAAERDAQTARAQVQAERERADAAEAHSQELSRKVTALDKLLEALMARVTSLAQRLAEATDRSVQLQLNLELRLVQQRLDDLNRDKFGQKSERRGRPDGESKPPKPQPKKKPKRGPTPQPKLRREPELFPLDDADLVCPKCSPVQPLVPWDGKTVDTEEITLIERSFIIKLIQRVVYRCPNCGHIETALGPKRLIPGGRYSPEFAATVAVDKYRDHLPLNRQADRMKQAGLVVTRQTLWDQIAALYILLLPSYLMLQERILASPLVHADETSWRLMKKGGTKKWWIWGITDGLRAFFLFSATRGQAAARQLFQGYDGIVMADRYAVYAALEKDKTKNGGEQLILIGDDDEKITVPRPDYRLAVCWAHGRREFVKAARHGEREAETALDLIAELYAVEAKAAAEVQHIADKDARKVALFAARKRLREAESRGIVERLRVWLDGVKFTPTSSLEKAVKWVNNGWTQLCRFLEDPRIPLDNNLAEQVIRGSVLGRKTHAGSRSTEGTRVAALFYSMVESCALEGVDARAYLIEATRRALEDRKSVFLPEDYAAMLRDRESGGAEKAELTAAELGDGGIAEKGGLDPGVGGTSG